MPLTVTRLFVSYNWLSAVCATTAPVTSANALTQRRNIGRGIYIITRGESLLADRYVWRDVQGRRRRQSQRRRREMPRRRMSAGQLALPRRAFPRGTLTATWPHPDLRQYRLPPRPFHGTGSAVR